MTTSSKIITSNSETDVNCECLYTHLVKSMLFNFATYRNLNCQVAYFPIRGNNCPLKLLSAFCEAAYTWLKEGLENVAVVHCKGGMERTGLMTSCLLLHLRVSASLRAFRWNIDTILEAVFHNLVTLFLRF